MNRFAVLAAVGIPFLLAGRMTGSRCMRLVGWALVGPLALAQAIIVIILIVLGAHRLLAWVRRR